MLGGVLLEIGRAREGAATLGGVLLDVIARGGGVGEALAQSGFCIRSMRDACPCPGSSPLSAL